MKHLLTITTAMAFSMTAMANPIDQQKAEGIAAQYMVAGHSMQLVKKASRAKATGVSAEVAKAAPYYIYSRGYDQGYVIVAGDDCLPEILGYTESGNFDESNLPPALEGMLQAWQNAVEHAQTNGTNAPRRASMAPALTATRENIAPLTTSHWHQTGPYNDLCPTRDDNGAKSMTGCVATAISQILYYWRRDLPSTLQATTPTYGMDGYSHASVTQSIPRGTPLKWDLMLDSYGSVPAEYSEAVATMVFAIGAAAHLEYSIEGGTATSGHIEDIPKAISTFFGMHGGWVAYRTSYTQEGWTQLIYDQLAKGYPVMYTGVHPTSGGHAVYIDGYQQKNDLMHFNFGWGGQSDGYYTTTLETGMNGFNDYQSCLIDAYPEKWNMKTTVNMPVHTYANIDNDVTITVENNSTLDFKGLYCFASSSNTAPTKLTSAKSFDDATVIARDSKGNITLKFRPTSIKTWYVTITDENLNILAQEAVEVEKAEAKLTLDRVEMLGTTENETVADIAYSKIYNNRAIVNAYLKNDADVAFGGIAKMNLYTSTDNGETFSFVKAVAKASVNIPAKGEGSVAFTLSDLIAGQLYYAEVDKEWGTAVDMTEVANTTTSKAYFISTGATDLTAELKDNVLCFAGHWDPTTYSSLVTRATNKTAVAYDLTNVASVGKLPEVTYPQVNALIYANEGAEGCNIVTNNVINGEAKFVAGYDFCLSSDITIKGKAVFDINQEPARWYLTTVPFAVDVPDGIIAREITGHATSSMGIIGKTKNVSMLEGGKSYLIMASSKQRHLLAASSSENIIKTTPVTNTDAAFVGVYSATAVPTGAKVMKEKDVDKQYFMLASGEMIEGLRGYFIDEKMGTATSDFRAHSDLTYDPGYLELAKRIQMLYDAKKEMTGKVSEKAETAMNDSIAKAEQLFTKQNIGASADVKKYYTALEAWIGEYKMMVDAVESADVDMTGSIVNPSFEASATAATGWSVGTTAETGIRKNSNLAYKTVYGDGNNFLYSNTGAAVTQTVTLVPGIYSLTAKVGSDEGNTITLFAGENEVTVAAHAFGKHYLTEARIDSIVVGASGELTIGVKAENWFNADDFRLIYIGSNEADGIVDVMQTAIPTIRKRGIYTLNGTKVSKITGPGVYVIDGKKMVLTTKPLRE